MIQLHTGNCLDVLASMPESFADSVVSDPPYGLSFMAAKWDHDVPGPDYWRAVLRVAKPGAHLLAFGGTRTFHRLTCAIEDAGFEVRDCLSWLYGQGFPKSHNGAWGGTALKPAWEPIILARKPLAGTVAANFAKHGTGGLNIDGCRIGWDASSLEKDTARRAAPRTDIRGGSMHAGGGDAGSYVGAAESPPGRWPANVLLDEEAGAMLDEQSGDRPGMSGGGSGRRDLSMFGVGGVTKPETIRGDNGGASRFFYCAKASRKERGDGNDHPTVKPTDLMRWLVRLVTPAGGVVLDPFMGSGSTGLAAVAEGRSFVGVDLEEKHVEIARRRLRERFPLEMAA